MSCHGTIFSSSNVNISFFYIVRRNGTTFRSPFLLDDITPPRATSSYFVLLLVLRQWNTPYRLVVWFLLQNIFRRRFIVEWVQYAAVVRYGLIGLADSRVDTCGQGISIMLTLRYMHRAYNSMVSTWKLSILNLALTRPVPPLTIPPSSDQWSYVALSARFVWSRSHVLARDFGILALKSSHARDCEIQSTLLCTSTTVAQCWYRMQDLLTMK